MNGKDPADCGNPIVDGMARAGKMMRVWDKLFSKFPMCQRWNIEIRKALKDGFVRAKITKDQRFTSIRDPLGPTTEAGWKLLAIAALEAADREPIEGEIDRLDGLWIGIPKDHPCLLARHKGCEWCAKGWIPSPTVTMPLAHVAGPKTSV